VAVSVIFSLFQQTNVLIGIVGSHDMVYSVLSTKHYLCDLHFEEHFLVKADILNIGGKAESFPRLRWSLTDDAIPTLFPNIPKYVSKRIVVRPPRKQTFVDDDRNAANVSSFECKLELDDTSVLETGQCPTEFECKSEIAIDHSYASTRCKNLSSCQLELLRLRKKVRRQAVRISQLHQTLQKLRKENITLHTKLDKQRRLPERTNTIISHWEQKLDS